MSANLSLSYKCLLNHIKYNKLELNLENLLSQLKNFIKYYQDSKLFYMKDTFKQEIKAVNNSKYWNILTDPHLLSISIILISMFRTKEPIPSTVKLFFVGFIIGLVVFKIFQIETQNPLKEEVQYMLNLQNKLNNIKNIKELCINDDPVFNNNRTMLLSAMLAKLNKLNKKIDLDLDISSDLSIIISRYNCDVSNNNNLINLTGDVSNNICDLSNNNLSSDVSNNNLTNLTSDVSNNNLTGELILLDSNNKEFDESIDTEDTDACSVNYDTSNNNLCDVINNQPIIADEKIEVNNQELDKPEELNKPEEPEIKQETITNNIKPKQPRKPRTQNKTVPKQKQQRQQRQPRKTKTQTQ